MKHRDGFKQLQNAADARAPTYPDAFKRGPWTGVAWVVWVILGVGYAAWPRCMLQILTNGALGECVPIDTRPVARLVYIGEELLEMGLFLFFVPRMHATRAPAHPAFAAAYFIGLNCPLSATYFAGGWAFKSFIYALVLWHVVYVARVAWRSFHATLPCVIEVFFFVGGLLFMGLLTGSTLPGTELELRHHYAFFLLATFAHLKHWVSIATCGFACGMCISGSVALGGAL